MKHLRLEAQSGDNEWVGEVREDRVADVGASDPSQHLKGAYADGCVMPEMLGPGPSVDVWWAATQWLRAALGSSAGGSVGLPCD